MRPYFQELDFQPSPIGDISLRRKRVALLGNQEVFEVKLGEDFLMSSMFHAVEDALSNLGLAALPPGDWDVIVGGLGLGYTAVAALAHPTVRSLRVVEYLPPVIRWHETGMVPLGPQLTGDLRCQFQLGDFFELAVSPEGFAAGQKFHAVLLDIDHSPHDLLSPKNASFYSQAGLTAMSAHLWPQGVFAMWSNDAPDADYMDLLCSVFPEVRAQVVTFPNPILEQDSASTVYIAQKA